MKQYEVKKLSSFIHVVYNTLPLFSVISQTFAAVTLYGVWDNSIIKYFPFMTLGVFLAIIIGAAIITLFLFYKFVYRGFYSFQNTQQFPEDGQLANLIRKIVREELNAHNENSTKS
jgi:hypothetical protein